MLLPLIILILIIDFGFLDALNHQKISMAGKPKRMSLVKQILRMHSLGKGIKTIGIKEYFRGVLKAYNLVSL
jgi:hypothetical protein